MFYCKELPLSKASLTTTSKEWFFQHLKNVANFDLFVNLAYYSYRRCFITYFQVLGIFGIVS